MCYLMPTPVYVYMISKRIVFSFKRVVRAHLFEHRLTTWNNLTLIILLNLNYLFAHGEMVSVIPIHH